MSLSRWSRSVAAPGGSGGGAIVAQGAPGTTLASGVTYFEQNGAGQVVAIWKGNGPGNAATKVLDVLLAGAFTPGGTWNAATAYGVSAIVSRLGGSYISLIGSTGVDPATDDGTHWQVLATKGAQGDAGPTGSPTTDQSIFLRHMADLARDPTLMAGHIAQAMDRRLPTSNVALTSGTLQLTGLPVPGGRALNHLTFYSGSIGATTPTHQWACLYDAGRNKLVVSNDDTTNAWAASNLKTFDLAAPYTPAAGALLYAGLVVVAATPNNLAAMGQANPVGQGPALAGTSTPGLTDPASAPATAAALVAKSPFWVSAS